MVSFCPCSVHLLCPRRRGAALAGSVCRSHVRTYADFTEFAVGAIKVIYSRPFNQMKTCVTQERSPDLTAAQERRCAEWIEVMKSVLALGDDLSWLHSVSQLGEDRLIN